MRTLTLLGSDWKDPHHRIFIMSKGAMAWKIHLTRGVNGSVMELLRGEETVPVDPKCPDESALNYLAQQLVEDTQYFFEYSIQRRKQIAYRVERLRQEVFANSLIFTFTTLVLGYLQTQGKASSSMTALIVGFFFTGLIFATARAWQMFRTDDWDVGSRVLSNEDEELLEWEEALQALYKAYPVEDANVE